MSQGIPPRSFYASCDCSTFFGGDDTKHNPGCPMDSNCRYCGQKPFLCKMFRTCRKNFLKQKDQSAIDDLRSRMMEISSKVRDLESKIYNLKNKNFKLSPSTSSGIFKIYQKSSSLQFKQPTAEVVSQMETLLWRMRRLYLNEKKRREQQNQLRAAENKAKKASEKGNAAKKVQNAAKCVNQAKRKSAAASAAASAASSASLLEN
jgi:hypothetical protein